MWNVPPPHDEWIENFLEIHAPSRTAPDWFSTFSAVVRDARQMTGRNLTTGIVEDESQAGSWLGALGYLVMLDQVGQCFRPTPLPREAPHPANVAKALTYFAPKLGDDEILALYALRCAFVHDYGLSSWGNIPHAAGLTHRFQSDRRREVSTDRAPGDTVERRLDRRVAAPEPDGRQPPRARRPGRIDRGERPGETAGRLARYRTAERNQRVVCSLRGDNLARRNVAAPADLADLAGRDAGRCPPPGSVPSSPWSM